MTERERLLEKIRKVQALANRGADGEKQSAAALLDRLMTQYGIDEAEIAEVKAATYDMKRASGLEKLEHTRRLQCWTVAKWALRVCGWAENVLLGVVILWVAFMLGAVLTGTVIVFGYPV